jgi:hypothetical protein
MMRESMRRPDVARNCNQSDLLRRLQYCEEFRIRDADGEAVGCQFVGRS